MGTETRPPLLRPVDDTGEGEIIRRVLDGDVNAYAALVVRHQDGLIGLAHRHAPPGAAVEVAHEAFVRAFEKLGTYRGEAPFGRWLARIALNLCRERWRRRIAERETPWPDEDREGPDAARDELDRAAKIVGEDHDRDRETRNLLDRAMVGLSPEDRQVLIMAHVEEYEMAEIASLLGWSVSKTKVRAHRARRKMRQELARLME